MTVGLDDRLRTCLDPVPAAWPASELRHAAVLCPLVARDGADHVLVVKRPDTLKRHAGQIAFPGGMQDAEESPLATALRECEEELGVRATRLTVLGALPPRVSTSSIHVTCLVARLVPGPIVPDPHEVERVLAVPFPALCDGGRWQEKPPPYRVLGRTLPLSPHFVHGDDVIWGLTGRFLFELVSRLTRAGTADPG